MLSSTCAFLYPQIQTPHAGWNDDIHLFHDVGSFHKKEILARTTNVTFSGSVQYPSGTIQYSRLMIYDPSTFEVIVIQNVCLGGSSFNIDVPMGIYHVYYRPFQGGARPYEVRNVDLTSDLDTVLVLSPVVTPEYFESASWSKVAIFKDDADTVSITVKVNDIYDLDSIYWFNEFNYFINPSVAYSQAKIILRDDGLGNDKTAGDHLFTSSPIKYNTSTYLPRVGHLGWAFTAFFQVMEGVIPTEYDYNGGYTNLGIVDPEAITYQPLVPLNDTFFFNDYLINLVRETGDDFISDAQTIYTYFPDTFDFLNIFFTNYILTPSNIHFQVTNDVQNIGLPLLNDAALYGSAGKLKGISNFQALTYQPPLNHETLHQWSQFMHVLFNSSIYGSHHGYSSIYGVHGGFDPADLSIVNPTTVHISSPVATHGYASDRTEFADLERYLMGSIGLSALRDEYYVLYDPVSLGGGDYSVSSIDTVTRQDILNQYGQRIPNEISADTDFHSAFIIVSDEELNDAAIAFYTYLAKTWADEIPEVNYLSFAEAAHYQASMTTRLPFNDACHVTNTNDAGPGSLRQGVGCVHTGDTLFFDPSLVNDTITLEAALEIEKDLIISVSPGQNIWINGSSLTNTLKILEGSTVEIIGIKCWGGNGPNGVIWNQGNLILDNVQVYGDGAPGTIFTNEGIFELKKGSAIWLTPQ